MYYIICSASQYDTDTSDELLDIVDYAGSGGNGETDLFCGRVFLDKGGGLLGKYRQCGIRITKLKM